MLLVGEIHALQMGIQSLIFFFTMPPKFLSMFLTVTLQRLYTIGSQM